MANKTERLLERHRLQSRATADDEDGALLLTANKPLHTADPFIRTQLREKAYLSYHRWHFAHTELDKPPVSRMRNVMSHLLPRLLGARDYGGAAKVLSSLYNRYHLHPATCIQSSLEIVRQDRSSDDQVVELLETFLDDKNLNRWHLLKELFYTHVGRGDYYEAHKVYKDDLEPMGTDDLRLRADFGMLCYWLLLIESPELRQFLRSEKSSDSRPIPEVDEEDRMGASPTPDKAEEMLVSRFQYKSPIGVSFLYQDAASCFRRAVSVAPHSSLFLSYYIQLLTLAGDLEVACDYLEHFIHANPSDPHGPRMYLLYLERYAPSSVETQVEMCKRWLELEPLSMEALMALKKCQRNKMVDLDQAVDILASALDKVGSEVYRPQNQQLWSRLASTIAHSKRKYHDPTWQRHWRKRTWWTTYYFSRPFSLEDALGASEDEYMDYVYKSAVAIRLCPSETPVWKVLRRAHFALRQGSNVTHVVPPHLRFYYARLHPAIQVPKLSIDMTKLHSLREQSFQSIVVADKDAPSTLHERQFVGQVAYTRPLDRKEVVGSRGESSITSTSVLEDELMDALEGEVLDHVLGGHVRPQHTPMDVPAYVHWMEVEMATHPNASKEHVREEVIRHMESMHASKPSVMEVDQAWEILRKRLEKNVSEYGRPVFLCQENIITSFVKKRVDFGDDKERIRKKLVKELVDILPNQVNVPLGFNLSRKVVKIAMYRKMMALRRNRRLRLREYKRAIKQISMKHEEMDKAVLVRAAYQVAQRTGDADLLKQADLQRIVYTVFVTEYKVRRKLQRKE